MTSRMTVLIFWLTLFLVVGAQAMPSPPASANGWQCLSNLALCEQYREQSALGSIAISPTLQAPK